MNAPILTDFMAMHGYDTPHTTRPGWIIRFNAQNFFTVAKYLRQRYHANQFYMAADNDQRTEGSRGLTLATKAERVVYAEMLMPEFNYGEQGTDWNNWHINLESLKGLQSERA